MLSIDEMAPRYDLCHAKAVKVDPMQCIPVHYLPTSKIRVIGDLEKSMEWMRTWDYPVAFQLPLSWKGPILAFLMTEHKFNKHDAELVMSEIGTYYAVYMDVFDYKTAVKNRLCDLDEAVVNSLEVFLMSKS